MTAIINFKDQISNALDQSLSVFKIVTDKKMRKGMTAVEIEAVEEAAEAMAKALHLMTQARRHLINAAA